MSPLDSGPLIDQSGISTYLPRFSFETDYRTHPSQSGLLDGLWDEDTGFRANGFSDSCGTANLRRREVDEILVCSISLSSALGVSGIDPNTGNLEWKI